MLFTFNIECLLYKPAPRWALASHTFCWEGGVLPPCELPNYWTDFQNLKSFDSFVCKISKHRVKFDLEVTDDVTGQVKVRMFDFSGLVTSASTISMLSANKANKLAWIVSQTFVSIIFCGL